MSDNKKYYYLKFKENFFDQDHIKVIEAMENGYIFSNILLKMYLRSLKFNGKLMITEKIPYDREKPEILARVLGHDVSHLRECIKIATALGIVKILDTGEIYMLDIQNFIGHSSTEADRIREYRGKIKESETKAITNVVTNVQQKNDIYTPEKEIEIDKEIYTYWNTKNFYNHSEEVIKKHIKKSHIDELALYSKEDIKKSIDNYITIYSSPSHYFSHRWTLWDFIGRGLYKFMDDAKPFETWRDKNKAGSAPVGNAMKKINTEGLR